LLSESSNLSKRSLTVWWSSLSIEMAFVSDLDFDMVLSFDDLKWLVEGRF